MFGDGIVISLRLWGSEREKNESESENALVEVKKMRTDLLVSTEERDRVQEEMNRAEDVAEVVRAKPDAAQEGQVGGALVDRMSMKQEWGAARSDLESVHEHVRTVQKPRASRDDL